MLFTVMKLAIVSEALQTSGSASERIMQECMMATAAIYFSWSSGMSIYTDICPSYNL